jgi:Flp pilus assembly protein TadB
MVEAQQIDDRHAYRDGSGRGFAMIGSVVHQCPKCELRFSFRTELEHHLREDHPQPAPAGPASAVKVDDAPARTATPVAAPARTRAETAERGGWSHARLAGLLLAVATALLVAYAAVFVSIWAALVVAGVVLVLSWFYVRRLRGRPRLPRR